MFWWGILIGLFVGAGLGVVTAGLLCGFRCGTCAIKNDFHNGLYWRTASEWRAAAHSPPTDLLN